jgi:hypothetical protein
MYRCPAPHGEGTVITNLMRERDANERECEPLHARRSTIDEPPRQEQRTDQRPERSNERGRATRFSDDWISTPAAGRRQDRTQETRLAAKAAPEPIGTAPSTLVASVVASAAVSTPLRAAEPAGGEGEKRVSKRVQQERDTDSRKIIQTELSKSLGMVDELRKRGETLVSGTPEHQRLQASLSRHSVDVEALKSELARMR